MELKKKVKFYPFNSTPVKEGKLLAPTPSYQKIPQWFKDLALVWNRNDLKELNPFVDRGADATNLSTKICPPFMDAFTSGYMYVLNEDLTVSLDPEGKPLISWEDGALLLVDKRIINDLPVPMGCHPIHFGFRTYFYYETPPGYSMLITHPLNRYDLPFLTQSAIIDSDEFGLPVFTPFFLKKGFTGVIKKGTPIFQMIPIKRDNWEMEVVLDDEAIQVKDYDAENRRSRLTGFYKSMYWKKKNYN